MSFRGDEFGRGGFLEDNYRENHEIVHVHDACGEDRPVLVPFADSADLVVKMGRERVLVDFARDPSKFKKGIDEILKLATSPEARLGTGAGTGVATIEGALDILEPFVAGQDLSLESLTPAIEEVLAWLGHQGIRWRTLYHMPRRPVGDWVQRGWMLHEDVDLSTEQAVRSATIWQSNGNGDFEKLSPMESDRIYVLVQENAPYLVPDPKLPLGFDHQSMVEVWEYIGPIEVVDNKAASNQSNPLHEFWSEKAPEGIPSPDEHFFAEYIERNSCNNLEWLRSASQWLDKSTIDKHLAKCPIGPKPPSVHAPSKESIKNLLSYPVTEFIWHGSVGDIRFFYPHVLQGKAIAPGNARLWYEHPHYGTLLGEGSIGAVAEHQNLAGESGKTEPTMVWEGSQGEVRLRSKNPWSSGSGSEQVQVLIGNVPFYVLGSAGGIKEFLEEFARALSQGQGSKGEDSKAPVYVFGNQEFLKDLPTATEQINANIRVVTAETVWLLVKALLEEFAPRVSKMIEATQDRDKFLSRLENTTFESQIHQLVSEVGVASTLLEQAQGKTSSSRVGFKDIENLDKPELAQLLQDVVTEFALASSKISKQLEPPTSDILLLQRLQVAIESVFITMDRSKINAGDLQQINAASIPNTEDHEWGILLYEKLSVSGETTYNDISQNPDLPQVARILGEAGVPYGVIGGIATLHHTGRVWVTHDIDIAILDRALIPASLLEANGFKRTGTFPFSENWVSPNGTPVHFTDQEQLQPGTERAIIVVVGGENLRVFTPEDLLHAKLVAASSEARRPSRRNSDIADIMFLLLEHPYLWDTLTLDERAFLGRQIQGKKSNIGRADEVREIVVRARTWLRYSGILDGVRRMLDIWKIKLVEASESEFGVLMEQFASELLSFFVARQSPLLPTPGTYATDIFERVEIEVDLERNNSAPVVMVSDNLATILSSSILLETIRRREVFLDKLAGFIANKQAELVDEIRNKRNPAVVQEEMQTGVCNLFGEFHLREDQVYCGQIAQRASDESFVFAKGRPIEGVPVLKELGELISLTMFNGFDSTGEVP